MSKYMMYCSQPSYSYALVYLLVLLLLLVGYPCFTLCLAGITQLAPGLLKVRALDIRSIGLGGEAGWKAVGRVLQEGSLQVRATCR